MNKLLKIITIIVVALSTMACSEEYIAEHNGEIMVIRDRQNIINDAILLNSDSIYVVKYGSSTVYSTLRHIGPDTIVRMNVRVNECELVRSHIYRKIPLKSLVAR